MRNLLSRQGTRTVPFNKVDFNGGRKAGWEEPLSPNYVMPVLKGSLQREGFKTTPSIL
jgi:hypothetical protein